MNERVKCILQNINSYQIGRPFAIIPRCPKRIEHKLQIELKSASIYTDIYIGMYSYISRCIVR